MRNKQPKEIEFTFKGRVELIDVDKLIPDEDNPRLIKRADFERLKKNIKANPNMLWIRPVVYAKGFKIKAGDKRWKACKELGLKRIPALNISALSAKEVENFHLWDNENVGTWDFEALKGWKDLHGIKIPDVEEKHKFNDLNCEMPIVPKYDEKYYAVMIVVESEMDFAHLCTLMDMGKAKDYKTSRVKQTQVISFNDFIKKIDEWKKSKL